MSAHLFSRPLIATCLVAVALSPVFAEDKPPVIAPPGAVPVIAAAPTAEDDAKVMKNASYLVGIQMGGAVKEYGLDIEQILKGINDTVSGKEPAIDMSKANEIMEAFKAIQQRKEVEKQAAQQAAAGTRKDTNAKWLAENGKKPNIKTTKSGLQYEVVASGAGKSPAMGDSVTCNYKGTLLDGTVFDASEKHGGPATFDVGHLIEGWNEALQLMKEGDKWKLYIPAALAYGDEAPPNIGPAQILLFELELIKVTPAAK